MHVADADTGAASDVGRHRHTAKISPHVVLQQLSRRYLHIVFLLTAYGCIMFAVLMLFAVHLE